MVVWPPMWTSMSVLMHVRIVVQKKQQSFAKIFSHVALSGVPICFESSIFHGGSSNVFHVDPPLKKTSL
jgi:hypothetical protein